jgi:hypothetical protein
MTATTGGGRRAAGSGLVALGGSLIVLGIVVAVVLSVVGRQRYADAVERLARAPVGCDTTLDVADSDTYFVYVETVGTLDERRGGCDAPSSYERDSDRLPRVRVEITSPDGDEIDLDRVSEFDYDRSGYRGTAIRRVAIEDTGDHVVRVTSAEFADDPSDADFVVAIGRDPDDVAAPMRAGAVALGASGLVLGLLAVAIGVVTGRRAPAAPAPTPFEWRLERPRVPGEPPVTGPPTRPPTPFAPPGATPAPRPTSPPAARPPGPPLPPPPPQDPGSADTAGSSRRPAPASDDRWPPPG